MKLAITMLLLACIAMIGVPMVLAHGTSSTSTERARPAPARPPSATSPRQCAPEPPGSYRLTCGNIWIACNGSYMTARCKTIRGNWVNTSLSDPFSCRGDIANIDGDLQCPR